ncbi:CHC2 zinc finger domain-containing protein [Robbsia sp. KACC 23696]|uniref:DNA primase n=1 Tax=Robbsia sp. KACC 23696 TaxID=3149231 RepID=UPI00325AB13F
MIPHAFLQDLIDRVDIVEVVGRYVQLKKTGANFSGLCPFHNEKSPSFTVSPTKQFFHCFGCGAHGTAIGFLMDHAGLPFPEAVESLAQSLGINVPNEPGPNQGQGYRGGSGGGASPSDNRQAAKKLSDVMRTACDYYRAQLRQSPEAIDYLKGRGLTGEIALRFGLGYAPGGWQNLEAAFDDYRDPRLVETGLLIVSNKRDGRDAESSAGHDVAERGEARHEDGATGHDDGAPRAPVDPRESREAVPIDRNARRYDRFRERIMFPIRNAAGHIIGFGGRVLHKGEPKYLNSPETPLFSKGNELYGLFEARLAIREKRFVLVVEGYMDVVALAQLGFPNAVATLGTACTPIHVQKLVRQTERIVFSFDGDAAGRRAARRALEASLPHAADNREMAFLFLPDKHDPDSYIREFGTDGFGEAVARAMPLSEFLLSEVCGGKDLGTPEGRAKSMYDAKPLLQAMPANALRLQIMHALADRLGVSVGEVAALCAVDARAVPARPKAPPIAARRRVTGNEQRALRNLVMYPRIVSVLDQAALDVIAECAQHRELFEEVITHARALGPQAEFRFLSDVLRESEYAPMFDDVFKEILHYDENVRDLMGIAGAGAADEPEDEQAVALAARRAEQARERMEAAEIGARAEVLAALATMRSENVAKRLDQLSRQSPLTPEQVAEMSALFRQMAELKQAAAARGAEQDGEA